MLKNGKVGVVGEELLKKSQMHVIAVDDDANVVNRLRRQLGADKRFLARFQAIIADPAKAHLPPYLANLIVS
jgi:hypothetical protein